MRVLVASDWRSQPVEWLFDVLDDLKQPVDLILYAGDDLDRFGDHNNETNALTALATQTRLGKVLAVAGNDDLPPSQELPPALQGDDPTSAQVLDADGVVNLHQEPFVKGEYVFLGQEGAIRGGPGLTVYSEAEIDEHLTRQFAEFQDKTPILVSHVPPNGILDIAQRFGQRHIGSTAVREFIEQVEPALTLCGHCHQFGGRARENDFGTVINIASHDDRGAKGRYGIIELDGDTVEYELRTTESGVETDLLQLSQVGGRRAQQLSEIDVTELSDITDDRRAELLELPGVYDWHVDTWVQETDAIQNGEIVLRDRESFAFLDNDDVVLLDIETDLKQERIWLVGLYSYRNEEFTRIFEKDDEEKLLQQVVEYLETHEHGPVVYYGNNRFDEQCLTQRLDVHSVGDSEALFADAYDLGIQIYNHLLGDFERTKLDAMAERLAAYEYEYPNIDGFYVGSQYTRYLLDDEEPDWQKLIEYNRDDVFALKAVVDEIQKLLSNI